MRGLPQVEAAAELRRKVEELDERIKGLRKDAQKQTAEGAKLNRAKASHQAVMETLQGRAADLTQAAAMEQVFFCGTRVILMQLNIQRYRPIASGPPAISILQGTAADLNNDAAMQQTLHLVLSALLCTFDVCRTFHAVASQQHSSPEVPLLSKLLHLGRYTLCVIADETGHRSLQDEPLFLPAHGSLPCKAADLLPETRFPFDAIPAANVLTCTSTPCISQPQ